MTPVLKHPSAFIGVALIAAIGMSLSWLPLFDLPGYELSSALTLMLALFSPYLGMCAAERLPARSDLGALLGALGSALMPAAMAALVPLTFAWLKALLSDHCQASTGSGFALLLPLPTAILGISLGICLARCLRRRGRALIALALLLVLSIANSLWPLWSGPQVFALHHLFGYFPGPIYDEALAVDARLIAFRALSLIWALALLLCAALASPASWQARWRSPHLWALFPCLLTLGLGWHFDSALGLRTGEADIDAVLGGKIETPHLTIHFPREKSKAQVQRLAFEMEFAWAELAEFFGTAPTGAVHAFFYRSPDEKRRLTGAARTDFAKPWRAQFHALDRPWPHPTARHELAHLFGAAFGSPIFGVSWRGFTGLNIGLIEGLAVAAEADDEAPFGLHEQARLMRELGLLPDLSSILDPVGFYALPGARAYTAVGSFLRFIHERHGAAALRALYPEGDFVAATGERFGELLSLWQDFLDGLTPSDRARSAAQQRFQPGSLFQRPCVREVASLEREARQIAALDPARALSLYERCSALVPEDPGFLLRRAELLLGQEDFAGAASLFEALSDTPTAAPHVRGRAMLSLAGIAWRQGQLASAREYLDRALAIPLQPGDERAAVIQRAALDDEPVREVLRRYFEQGAGLAELLTLQRLSEARPDWPLGPYLIGRQLWMRGQGAEAIPFLRRAHEAGLGHPSLVEENLRIWVEAAFWADDLDEVQQALSMWRAQGDEVSRRGLASWQARCAFREKMRAKEEIGKRAAD